MLWDILGILIAFASVMLFFSLMVTTLAQGIQQVAQQRYRVLRQQLTDFASQIGQEFPHTQAFLAQAIGQMLDENSFNGRLVKEVAHVGKEEIRSRIIRICDGTAEDQTLPEGATTSLQLLDELFPKLETAMRHQFKAWMDRMAVVLAFTLALVFHLNAFDLLRSISANPEVAAAYSQYGAEQAAAGDIDTARAGEPEVQEFNTVTKVVAQEFAIFQFTPFPQDCDCYLVTDGPNPVLRTLGNLLGILISTLLISLGAPFWFRTLHNLFRIREQVVGVDSGSRSAG